MTEPHAAEEIRPFVVPCRRLDGRAPLRWLAAGWQDVRRAPALTAAYGVVIVLVSVAISALAWQLGRFALLAALLSGFVFAAPLIAVGLYSVSRALEEGRSPRLSDSFRLVRSIPGQAAVFALIQMVILFTWSRSGMMVSAFMSIESNDARSLIEFLAVGSAFGTIFAALTFSTAVFSLPMIADRDVDMVTAVVSSVNAVLRNKRVAMFWAFLIALITLLGFSTAFIGLGVLMPWLAYSAWHSYRETLDCSVWPKLQTSRDDGSLRERE
ncbi:MAG: DUF2189 domain-containing protein [Acidibacter sp.]|jgi:uncharacterized membrane protein|nr:DUF2189 domain-containing protein [Acidibacter sp.]